MYRVPIPGLVLGMVSMVALLLGCSSPAPTATPLPPTAPPTEVIQPTATSEPTTVPATANAAAAGGGALSDALAQVKAAASYRVNLSISGQGNFVVAQGGPTPDPSQPNKPVTLVTMQGEVNGQDAHFTLQGLLTSFLGIDPAKPFEVISSGGKAYLRGPVPLLGANQDKWYVAPEQAAQVAQPPLTPGSFLDSFGQAGINPADFKPSGAEALDGKSCTIYAGDKSAVVNAFNKLGGQTGATQADLNSIDNAQFKFWVCDDGYLHQVQMLIEGHDKNKPDQTGSFEILMKITDFNSNITITPPTGAEQLQLPAPPAGEFGATPSPTP